MNAVWAKSTQGSENSFFQSVVGDSSGNMYVCGYKGWSGGGQTVNFGNSITLLGYYSDTRLIGKYNSSGVAQSIYAATSATPAGGSNNHVSGCEKIAIDGNGNLYSIGSIKSGGGSVSFGSVSVTPPSGSVQYPLLLKYNSSGTAQFAVSPPDNNIYFFALAVNPTSGDIYIGGKMTSGTRDFGNGVSISGNTGTSAFLVKYNSNGVAQWARTPDSGTASYIDVGVIGIDSAGNVVISGEVYQGNMTWGGTTTTKDRYIAKFNSSGTLQWVKDSPLYPYGSIKMDTSNNIVLASASGTGERDFGNGVKVTVVSSNYSPVIAKYDSNGNALWALTATTAPADSYGEFADLGIDSFGNIYAVGRVNSASSLGPYIFGGVTSASIEGVAISRNTPFILKVNSSGAPLMGKTPITQPANSGFRGLYVDSSGNAFGVGVMDSSQTYNFGGSSGNFNGGFFNNGFIVKYE